MQDKKDTGSSGISIHHQLKKVDQMERQVANLHNHLNFLLKQESKEKKKIDDMYHNSVRITGNKLNHVSMHLHSKELARSRVNDCTNKQSQVKVMRQKEIDHLRETRLQVSNLKDRETKQIRQLSRHNENIIKASRQTDKENNITKVSLARKENQEKKEKLTSERESMKKYIEEQNLKEKKKRIAQQTRLQDEMEKLKKQHELVEDRIRRRQQIQLKIQQTARGIHTMEDEDVIALAQVCKSEDRLRETYQPPGRIKPSNINKQELFKKALYQDKPYML